MSGEKSVRSGNDGEKMMREFLNLVGWSSISQNVQFNCTQGKKHKGKKSKEDREHHDIDGTFYYDSPLNHAETDIVLCSSKHNSITYTDSSKAYGFLKDLAQSLECASKDYDFVNDFENNNQKRKIFKGLLFWVSSNPEELQTSMIDKISLGLIKDEEEEPGISVKLRGINYDSIYVVDNAKTSFILGAVKTAQDMHPMKRIQFLFPHTGANNRTEDLKGYGYTMPIQYINSSILPIVIDEGDKVSVLIFCDSNYQREYLKRIIWLVHKTSDLVGSVDIFFNDYDTTRDEVSANRVKQLFQNSPLAAKITIRKTKRFDFITLKEEQVEREYNSVSSNRLKRLGVADALPEESDLDKMLPYGEMIKPIIASSSLSETDLKSFLIRKGVYVGNADKQSTVPLLSTLLLSPEELSILKYLLKVKEDKVKTVPRSASLHASGPTIDDIAPLVDYAINELSTDLVLPANCKFHSRPNIQITDNEIHIPFILEKQNSTKDLITGKVHNEGSIHLKIVQNNLEGQINYTSRETFVYGNKIFKQFEKTLLENQIIIEEFYCIRFGSFDNSNRIDFFLNFLSTQGQRVFSEARLEHIVVTPDGSLTEELPYDLESLKNKVNHLAISGQDLDKVHFFEEKYKKALLMQRVKIKYDYFIANGKGKCHVDLDFKGALQNGIDNDTELVFNLEIIKKGSEAKNLEAITKKLSKAFNELIQEKYKTKFLIKSI